MYFVVCSTGSGQPIMSKEEHSSKLGKISRCVCIGLRKQGMGAHKICLFFRLKLFIPSNYCYATFITSLIDFVSYKMHMQY